MLEGCHSSFWMSCDFFCSFYGQENMSIEREVQASELSFGSHASFLVGETLILGPGEAHG